MKAFAGIDPGQSGAIAVIGADGSMAVEDWPGDERALIDLVEGLRFEHGEINVLVEKQQAMPGQGVSSMFKLGFNYGLWLAAVASARWPLREVRACEWKRGLGYPAGDYSASKKHSLALARRMFPSMADRLKRVKDNGRAEALLLAHVARGGKFDA